MFLERVTRIELVTEAWEAFVIPFHHTRALRRDVGPDNSAVNGNSCLFGFRIDNRDLTIAVKSEDRSKIGFRDHLPDGFGGFYRNFDVGRIAMMIFKCRVVPSLCGL